MLENLKLAWQNPLNSLDKEITNISIIKEIIKSSNELKNKAVVIKLPSVIITNDDLFSSFIESIRLLNMCGAKIYIVHDHIDLRNLSLISGIDKNFSKKISKIDINNSINNTVIMEILSSYVNKLIVTKLSNVGCYAIGISGKDANLLQARKSTLLNRRVANRDVIDIGFISEPIIVTPEILLNFEDHNIIPVITPFAHDSQENAHLLNVNLTAAVIASTLGAEHLILPYKKSKTFNGFPYNVKVQNSNLLKSMLNDNNQLIEEELIKIGINILENSNNYVHFVNSEVPNSILLTTFINNTDFY
ncbi:MAG: acetylglutamate kinase [Rickettsia endosymbiont of Pentastiridius leporinus]